MKNVTITLLDVDADDVLSVEAWLQEQGLNYSLGEPR